MNKIIEVKCEKSKNKKISQKFINFPIHFLFSPRFLLFFLFFNTNSLLLTSHRNAWCSNLCSHVSLVSIHPRESHPGAASISCGTTLETFRVVRCIPTVVRKIFAIKSDETKMSPRGIASPHAAYDTSIRHMERFCEA